MEIKTIRELLCESGKKLLQENLVSGTWGNISCRIDEGHMLITPSGISYEDLTPEDMVPVDITNLSYGRVTKRFSDVLLAAGIKDLKPSTEAPLHAAIYKTNKEINAVIHTHSLYAGIIAALGTEVLPYSADMAMILGPTVRVAGFAWPGSEELAQMAAEGLRDRYAVLLQNHGAVCIGRDMEEAFTACLILEKACQIQISVQMLGGGKPISQQDAIKYREQYLNVYQKNRIKNRKMYQK